MSLNIENEETHQLAGESVQRERSVETQMQQLRAIRKRCAGLLKTGGPSAVEHGDLLYDEKGCLVRTKGSRHHGLPN